MRRAVCAAFAVAATAVVLIVTGVAGAAAPSAGKSAADTYAKYLKLPTSFNIPPIGKPAPLNKKLVFISCPLPSCEIGYQGVVQAVKALHWKVTKLTPQFTPESFQGAWDSAVQAKPNVIIAFAPFPLTTVRTQLNQAKAAGIVVATAGASGFPVGGASPLTANINGTNTFAQLGKIYVDTAYHDTKYISNVALAIDPSIPVWGPIIAGWKKEAAALGGQYNELDTTLADIGKNTPSQIVTYLQAHPNIKSVFLTLNSMIIGVPQALTAAGLGDIKLYTGATDTTDVAQIKTGVETASVAVETLQGMWRLVDAAVRKLDGVSTSCCTQPSGTFLIVNKQNIALAHDIRAFPYANNIFLKAWGLKK